MNRELLLESEEKYRTLTQNLNVAVFRAHMYGYLEAEIVELNPAFLEMFGYENLEEVQLIDRGALFASHEERVRFNNAMTEQGRVVDMEVLLQ